jgi:uncharacterized protein (DUF2141 family)
MRHKISLFIVFYLISFLSSAQLTLTIDITGLRNSKGMVHGELRNENDKPVDSQTKNISANQCRIVFENLKPGMYAFQFIHDENSNEKLDTNWLGIPKEGFGYSNNPSLITGPPSIKKTSFKLYESTVINCKTIYL